MKKQTKKVIVISGASSGIGLTTANYFLENGWVVYGIARKPSEEIKADFNYYQGDICDSTLMQKIAKEIFDKEGQIDILFNNAGFGISGAIEFTEKEKVEKIFDVNTIAQIDMCKIYIPYLRKTKGKIIFTSSVAAPAAIPFQACYSATKAAIESFALALSKEVRNQGIKIACVRPGDIKTGFTEARDKNEQTSENYGDIIEKKTSNMEKCENNGMQPITVSKLVYKVANRKNPPLISSVGLGYKCISSMLKIVPVRWSNYLVYKFY
ncbi:MAG: SDR family NAD(P)-dependent oxidoreductase [Clostridia bacterium]|nr:SDR family NAD(P)-dependent oxidoreductase [Clostridia bacterium]